MLFKTLFEGRIYYKPKIIEEKNVCILVICQKPKYHIFFSKLM